METDPNVSENALVSQDVKIGPSVMMVSFAPYILVDQASADGVKAAASRGSQNGGNNATVDLQGSAANPLFPFAPAIDYEFQVTVVPGQAPTVTGSHDGFPAYTISVTNQDRQVVGAYQYTPSGNFFEPRRLLPGKDVIVRGEK